jgi:hypothetical protein
VLEVTRCRRESAQNAGLVLLTIFLARRRRARYLARSPARLLHFNLTLPVLDIVPSIR